MGEYHQELQSDHDTRQQVADIWSLPKEQIDAYVVVAFRHRPDGEHSFAWATNLPDEAAAGFLFAAMENHVVALVSQEIADMVPDDISSLGNI